MVSFIPDYSFVSEAVFVNTQRCVRLSPEALLTHRNQASEYDVLWFDIYTVNVVAELQGHASEAALLARVHIWSPPSPPTVPVS